MFRDFKKYEIFEDGRIWSYKSNKWLKPTLHSSGYLAVHLSDNDGEMKKYLHHRVVYEACSQAPIPEGFDVNHIDEDKTNNHMSNLDLMTRKENVNWGSRNERIVKAKSKKIEQYDKDGNLIQVWPSIIEVHRQLGYSRGGISMCCNGKRKTNKGFIWKFAS